MQSMQRQTFYSTDLNRYGTESQHSAYLQDPKGNSKVYF